MLFQTWQYLCLLVFAILSILLINNVVVKKVVVLIISTFFYAYGAKWQTILFGAVIGLAFFFGILLEKKRNKFLLVAVICILFCPLFLYKYMPFLLAQFAPSYAQGFSNIFVLPIGISFYSFQAVGYVVDVYRRQVKAERNILDLACFLSFFPQLVAGPIERYDNLIGQINEMKKPDYTKMVSGFRHIVLGLTLKLLVAETMAGFVNPVYNNLSGKGGLAVLIATFCFGIQIYCDFNGYTQIAIGSAELMGIHLMQNFNHPYRATSITDFWRRWHISLSSWFKDYLYIPLGGNQKGPVLTACNSVITFLVSGIWHGANWTFALWGFANGLGVALEKRYLKKVRKSKFLSLCYSIITFFIVNLCWVFFRANSVHDAFLSYKLIFTDTIPQLVSLNSASKVFRFFLRENGWSYASMLPMAVSILIYIWYEFWNQSRVGLENCLFSRKTPVRWVVYILLLFATLYFGKTLAQSDFVYFRF